MKSRTRPTHRAARRHALLAWLALASAAAQAQPSPEIWAREIIPASPQQAPQALVLPGPWQRQMDEAMEMTLRDKVEHAGCLLFDVMPGDLERRQRAADAVLKADAASMGAALQALDAEVRDTTTNGPVAGSTYAGLAYSVEDTPDCGLGGSYFHTHPDKDAPHTLRQFPSGADFTAGVLAVLRGTGPTQPILVIRSSRGYYALVPTLKATDLLGFGKQARTRAQGVVSRRVGWGYDQNRAELLRAGLSAITDLQMLACIRPVEAQAHACMKSLLARLAADAGLAVYFGDTDGTLQKVAVDTGTPDLTLPIQATDIVAANIMAARTWPPPDPEALLRTPRWSELVPDDMRQVHAFYRPWLERAGWKLGDQHLAYLRHTGQGGTHFRLDPLRGWPQLNPLDNAAAQASERGLDLWLGQRVCRLRSAVHERLFITMLVEHHMPRTAKTMADVQPLEGGRTAIVVADAQGLVGSALQGRVAGGVPVYEGSLPVYWIPEGTTHWRGRFLMRPDAGCERGVPYVADGEGVAEHRDKAGRLLFTLRGTARSGLFTGTVYDPQGRPKQALKDMPSLID